jgi:SAM-dependent methyltransferase
LTASQKASIKQKINSTVKALINMPSNTPKRHCDLGCGTKPRNPYHCEQLFGVDIRSHQEDSVDVRQANLVMAPIPYPDNFFHSVSAYDFLEHVPRVLPGSQAGTTRFPFVELMNEIWRVLVPGGRLYACTPAYPHAAAFQDPTHVNIITNETHQYFTQPTLLARMYGFTGDFAVLRVLPAKGGEFDYEPVAAPDFMRRYRLRRRARRGENSHLVWEFEARKATGG